MQPVPIHFLLFKVCILKQELEKILKFNSFRIDNSSNVVGLDPLQEWNRFQIPVLPLHGFDSLHVRRHLPAQSVPRSFFCLLHHEGAALVLRHYPSYFSLLLQCPLQIGSHRSACRGLVGQRASLRVRDRSCATCEPVFLLLEIEHCALRNPSS